MKFKLKNLIPLSVALLISGCGPDKIEGAAKFLTSISGGRILTPESPVIVGQYFRTSGVFANHVKSTRTFSSDGKVEIVHQLEGGERRSERFNYVKQGNYLQLIEAEGNGIADRCLISGTKMFCGFMKTTQSIVQLSSSSWKINGNLFSVSESRYGASTIYTVADPVQPLVYFFDAFGNWLQCWAPDYYEIQN